MLSSPPVSWPRRLMTAARNSAAGHRIWGVLRRSASIRSLVNGLHLAPSRSGPTRPLKELCDPSRDELPAPLSDPAFRISVLTPTFNTDPRYLRELLQTLRNQHYSNWEWVVVDDGSTHAATVATLRELAATDPRVRVFVNPKNMGISAATNVALAAATGTHAALVDHDDLVSRDAFLQIYQDWRANPSTQLFYTDECKLNSEGVLEQFWPKPDWSPAYLENTMCIGHLAVYEMRFLRTLGGLRSEFDGTQDFDLALRAALSKPRVRHLPVFAYVWRIIPGSAALDLNQKSYAVDRQRKAVLDYARQGVADAEVVPGWGPGYWRIRYPLPSPPPLLSYVIAATSALPGKRGDLLTRCIRSLEKRNFYPNSEYVVVHDGNLTDRQLRELRANPRIILARNDATAANISHALNLGVAHAHGEFICLLDDGVDVITARGGEELVSYLAVNGEVGAMGPLCLNKNGTILQNGIVLLARGPASAGSGQWRDFGGHQGIFRCRRAVLGVGIAAMFVKKSVYEAVGGFSEDLPRYFNDLDFCLKLQQRGYACVVDPAVEVYHSQRADQQDNSTVERERLYLKHPNLSDPYFNKWFDSTDPSFRVSLRDREAT